MKKRAYGTGSVLKLKYKDKETRKVTESRYWYILYYSNGRRIRESSESESQTFAENLLMRRMGEATVGIQPQQDVKGIKYEDVRDAYLAEAHNKGLRFDQRADGTEYFNGVPNLDEFFKGMRVIDISTDTLRRFIEKRREIGAADATIRRNLAVLRAMLNQARKEAKLRMSDIPYFPMPKEGAPRKGFLEPDVFAQLQAAMPKDLRPLVTSLYDTGCRVGAAEQVTWEMVSRDCKEIELPGEITKSGEPLTLPLAGSGLSEISAMLRKMFRKPGPVFDTTNLRQEWCKACASLGLGKYDEKARRYEGLTIHDFRRSAVRSHHARRGPSGDRDVDYGRTKRSTFSSATTLRIPPISARR